MNFKIGYGFHHFSKAIVFGLNSLVFVRTMSHRFKAFKYHDFVRSFKASNFHDSFIARNNLTFEAIRDCLKTKNDVFRPNAIILAPC